MDVGSHIAFIAGKASDLDVLADGLNLLGGQVSDGHFAAASFASQQSVYISRILLYNGLSAGVNECLEISVLCNEVGLSVYFDYNANLLSSVNICFYDTFSSDASSFFSSSSQTLFAQQLDCFFLVAVGFGQCFFAVHHAAAGDFTQCFYVLSGECHIKFLQTEMINL